jgi:hypothetical protein
MPRHFFQLWHHTTADWHLECSWVLDHTASDQKRLGNVEPDDTVWAITVYPGGKLVLLGRLVVEDCIDQKSAEERFDYEVWEAKYHAIAKPGTVESLQKVDLMDLAQDLRFVSKKNRLRVTDGRVMAQQLQSMRELTPESARMLEEKWTKTKQIES